MMTANQVGKTVKRLSTVHRSDAKTSRKVTCKVRASGKNRSASE